MIILASHLAGLSVKTFIVLYMNTTKGIVCGVIIILRAGQAYTANDISWFDVHGKWKTLQKQDIVEGGGSIRST